MGEGLVSKEFDTFLPKAISICMRVNIQYNRHGDQLFWFEVTLNNEGKKKMSAIGDFAFYASSDGQWMVDSNGNDVIPIRTIFGKQ